MGDDAFGGDGARGGQVERNWVERNAFQRLSYFVAARLVLLTGLGMSPAL
ncbi:hypothetical protein [Streptomyces hainanensis]|nr:hypothetical protein [Streptomyces hainanensis]